MKKLLAVVAVATLLTPSLAHAQNAAATSVPPAYQAGVQPLSMDLSGNLRAVHIPSALASAGLTQVTNATAASGLVIKNAPGNLYSVYAISTVAGYLMIFNASSTPVDGTVAPAECIPVAANGTAGVSYNATGEFFSIGIIAAFSSAVTCFTKTTSATAFIHATRQ